MSGKLRLSSAVFVLSLMPLAIGHSAKPNAGPFSWEFKLLAANSDHTPKRDCHTYVATNTNSVSKAPIASFEPTFGVGAATLNPTATTTQPTSGPTATVHTTAIPVMTTVPIPTPVPTAKVIPTASPTQAPFSTIVPTTVDSRSNTDQCIDCNPSFNC